MNKIAKQMYPSSAFPFKERMHLRQTAKETITEYLDKNPNVTYEEILQHYVDNEESITSQKLSTVHRTKIIVCIGLLLAIICTLCFSIVNGWNPPTYIV
ncbi:MAG: hypothetical protein K2J67_00330 [Lachnospiraceae bacterium]|nr:hypothetical protein [Lachnospiraceae bacterium]